jgi:16S rRNA (cytosine1402-N4)-methyltransferase
VRHVPVLVAEVLELLAVRPGGFYVDGTVGLGGHAAALLERSGPDGRLLGVDRDPQALAEAAERLRPFGARVELRHADYRELPALLADARPDGVLLDLGVSSLQLEAAERGFSFRADGPLDMRMDPSRGWTAAEVVNRWSEARLAELIQRWGEEPRARRVARALVEARRRAPLRTTHELAAVVRRAAGRTRRGLDPATRTFQALRIEVNQELAGLGTAVSALGRALAVHGRLAVIAFHSLEDREVKHALRTLPRPAFRILTPKPLRPGAAELRENPRARSARLRAVAREAA